MRTDFSAEDRDQLELHGLPVREAARQLHLLRSPPRPFALVRPCTTGDGVWTVDGEEEKELRDRFRTAVAAGRSLKFVPASGAATRMFRPLQARHATRRGNDPGGGGLQRLRREIDHLALGKPLSEELAARGTDLESTDDETFLAVLLGGDGLDLAASPKGLIPFHRYGETTRTAFEEHLVEAARHLTDERGRCRVHFTVPASHRASCEEHLADAARRFGAELGVDFVIGTSVQSPATDTLALAEDGAPFRRDDGSLLLRPGGHGALLGNLDDLDGDLVLIKNVDNVLREERQETVIAAHEVLGGLAVDLQESIHERLRAVRGDDEAADLAEIHGFLVDELGTPPIDGFEAAPAQRRRALLANALDRPLRVCFVVENEGEPGGGPFWVERPGEPVRRQIVEGAEVSDDPEQREIFESGTHFNPVQMVCALRDPSGESYDLTRFVDESAVFVTSKTHRGRRLKALERPGLWNGAMAGWITVFVEVPAETFTPVKTVLDLLRPGHRVED